MRKAANGCVLACALALLGPGALAESEPRPAVDARARKLVEAKAASVAAAKRFRVDTEYSLEVVLESGEKLQYVGESTSWLERPNRLRTDRKGERGTTRFLYDGKQVTLYADPPGFYATREAPHDLDAMLDFVLDELGVAPPALDLLYGDKGAGLLADVTSGSYLGVAQIGGRTCHHVAFREPDVDWQLWVEDGTEAHPCRYVITTLDVEGAPQTTVTVRKWQNDPDIPAGFFEFEAPDGAMPIKFEDRTSAADAAGEEGR